MKILIFIEVDVVVRHFVYSSAFVELEKYHEVAYVYPFNHKRLGLVDPRKTHPSNIRLYDLPVCKDRLKIWRYLFFVEQLRGRPGQPKLHIQSYRTLFKNGNPLYGYILFRFLGLPCIFHIFRFLATHYLRLLSNTPLENILTDYQPDLVIHPCVLEGLYINDLVSYCNHNSIQLLVLMNSWDNPASKRSVVGTDYWLFVWGPQTRIHAETIMQMPSSRVIEFGSAQFDILYRNPNSTAEHTLSLNQIYNSKPTILYAGSSKATDEFSHLMEIDLAIENKSLPSLNVIYRPHPWGGCGVNPSRFLDYKFKNIYFDHSMLDYIHQSASGIDSKFLASYSDARDLLSSVDCVISPLSTILIESLILGKPPMCFMPVDETGAEHFQAAKSQVHFRDILNHEHVQVCWSIDELIASIPKLIARSKDSESLGYLRRSSEYFVRSFDVPYSQRLLDFVESFAS